MNKNLYRSENFISEEMNNERIVLEYYLTKSEHPFKTGNINYICYGVEVRMRKENKNEYYEIQLSDGIFSSKDMAINFINKIADNLVTPCTLENVVSDMLLEALA